MYNIVVGRYKMDLFGFVTPKRVKRLDSNSEQFISLVQKIPEDSIRMVREDTWISFGELQSRIVVFGFAGRLAEYVCPSVVAHRILCRL